MSREIVRSQELCKEIYSWKAQNFDTIPLQMVEDCFKEADWCDIGLVFTKSEKFADLTAENCREEMGEHDFVYEYSIFPAHAWLWNVADTYLSEWIKNNLQVVYDIGFRVFECSYFDTVLLGTDVVGTNLFYYLWMPLYDQYYKHLDNKINRAGE